MTSPAICPTCEVLFMVVEKGAVVAIGVGKHSLRAGIRDRRRMERLVVLSTVLVDDRFS